MPEADAKLFLANLEADVGERTNVAAQHPDIVQHLQKLHDDWIAALPARATSDHKRRVR